MNELVIVNNKEIWTDSRIVAEKLTNGKHAHVKRAIDLLIKDIEEIYPPSKGALNNKKSIPKVIYKKGTYRNQEFEYYLLNKFAFIWLATRFKTIEAKRWQAKFIEAFFEMEEALSRQKDLEWIQTREQGKLARRQETDIIKEYVEYATNQGSKNANKYYIHLTKATYKALGLLQHNKPATRDMLDTLQIYQIVMAEMVVSTSLRKYMALGVSYKQIFQLVKDDLDSYSGLIDMTGVKQLAVKG